MPWKLERDKKKFQTKIYHTGQNFRWGHIARVNWYSSKTLFKLVSRLKYSICFFDDHQNIPIKPFSSFLFMWYDNIYWCIYLLWLLHFFDALSILVFFFEWPIKSTFLRIVVTPWDIICNFDCTIRSTASSNTSFFLCFFVVFKDTWHYWKLSKTSLLTWCISTYV